MTAINKENSKVFLLTLLGMLSAFGPFVTDMYLPSLPAMADYFSASLPMVQMGLTTSMIGLALGQIFFGPLSDKYGRRPLLLVSMVLFIVSTLLCLFAPDIYSFVTLRLIQGVAGAGGIVISRSVATDKFSGKELAKMLAVIGAINGVAPVAAPVIGGLLTGSVGWQGIFMILLFIGILLGIGCIRFKESLPTEKRSKTGVFATFRSFGIIVHNRRYMLYVLQLAFAQGILFAYIASSPFIIQQHYGFSPFAFSICFAVNADFHSLYHSGDGLRTQICGSCFRFAGCTLFRIRRHRFSIGRTGRYPPVYRSNFCGLCCLFTAVCIVGSETNSVEGCGMPYLIHPTWHIYFDILWVIFLHAA